MKNKKKNWFKVGDIVKVSPRVFGASVYRERLAKIISVKDPNYPTLCWLDYPKDIIATTAWNYRELIKVFDADPDKVCKNK